MKKKISNKLNHHSGKSEYSIHNMDKEVWPLERDIFFRPGRMKYVRKLIKTNGCVFCLSGQNNPSVKNFCVFKTKYSQVVINKFPYNNGHVLVLPLRHTGELLNLSDEEYFDLQNLIRLTFKIISNEYKPQGFNLGLNHGAIGGAGIPDHLHYHIVPRWHGDLNFFPLIAETKLVIEDVRTTYKRLKKAFQKQNKKEHAI